MTNPAAGPPAVVDLQKARAAKVAAAGGGPDSAQFPNHLDRTHYSDLVDALNDAARVADDLESATRGQLLVRSDDIAFLTHRLRQLVDACLGSVPTSSPTPRREP